MELSIRVQFPAVAPDGFLVVSIRRMKPARLRIFSAVSVTLFVGLTIFFLLWRDDAGGVAEACRSSPQTLKDKCYENLMTKALVTRGLPAALELVGESSTNDAWFGGNCHLTMHAVGKYAYDQYSKGSPLDMTKKVSYCNYGFFHGFMEEMAAQTGSVAQAKKFCDFVGEQLKEDSAMKSNCYHGIGHGVVDGYDSRVWGDAITMTAPGLKLCHEVTTDDELLRSCEMGAFNSLELMYPDSKYRLDFGDDPYVLCRKPVYDDNEKKACYTEMSVLVTTDFARGDFSKALGYIRNVEPAYRLYTVRYIAIYSVPQVSSGNPVDLFDACRKLGTAYESTCVIGLTQGSLAYGAPGKRYQRAIDFCRQVSLTVSERKLCVHTIVFSDTSSDAERNAVCRVLPKDMRTEDCKV